MLETKQTMPWSCLGWACSRSSIHRFDSPELKTGKWPHVPFTRSGGSSVADDRDCSARINLDVTVSMTCCCSITVWMSCAISPSFTELFLKSLKTRSPPSLIDTPVTRSEAAEISAKIPRRRGKTSRRSAKKATGLGKQLIKVEQPELDIFADFKNCSEWSTAVKNCYNAFCGVHEFRAVNVSLWTQIWQQTCAHMAHTLFLFLFFSLCLHFFLPFSIIQCKHTHTHTHTHTQNTHTHCYPSHTFPFDSLPFVMRMRAWAIVTTFFRAQFYAHTHAQVSPTRGQGEKWRKKSMMCRLFIMPDTAAGLWAEKVPFFVPPLCTNLN